MTSCENQQYAAKNNRCRSVAQQSVNTILFLIRQAEQRKYKTPMSNKRHKQSRTWSSFSFSRVRKIPFSSVQFFKGHLYFSDSTHVWTLKIQATYHWQQKSIIARTPFLYFLAKTSLYWSYKWQKNLLVKSNRCLIGKEEGKEMQKKINSS